MCIPNGRYAVVEEPLEPAQEEIPICNQYVVPFTKETGVVKFCSSKASYVATPVVWFVSQADPDKDVQGTQLLSASNENDQLAVVLYPQPMCVDFRFILNPVTVQFSGATIFMYVVTPAPFGRADVTQK